jgi:hypothetical protein
MVWMTRSNSGARAWGQWFGRLTLSSGIHVHTKGIIHVSLLLKICRFFPPLTWLSEPGASPSIFNARCSWFAEPLKQMAKAWEEIRIEVSTDKEFEEAIAYKGLTCALPTHCNPPPPPEKESFSLVLTTSRLGLLAGVAAFTCPDC